MFLYISPFSSEKSVTLNKTFPVSTFMTENKVRGGPNEGLNTNKKKFETRLFIHSNTYQKVSSSELPEVVIFGFSRLKNAFRNC